MDELKEGLKKYLERNFKIEDDLLYFGEVSEKSSEEKSGEIPLMLRVNDTHSGYLIINLEKDSHQVSFSGENDGVVIDIYRDKSVIKFEPYQVTKESVRVPQAVTKEDWVTPKSLELTLEGNYTPHRLAMELASRKHIKGEKSELWLPNLILNE